MTDLNEAIDQIRNGQDEAGEASGEKLVFLDGNRVQATFKWRGKAPKKDDNPNDPIFVQRTHTAVYDFNGMSLQQLQELCVKQVNQILQQDMRNDLLEDGQINASDYVEIDVVRDIVGRKRGAKKLNLASLLAGLREKGIDEETIELVRQQHAKKLQQAQQ
jgi:hypothetical protein